MWGEEEGGGTDLIPEQGGIAAAKGGVGREGAAPRSHWQHHFVEVWARLYV